MGSLPAVFSGNRAEAEHFINGIQAYIRLNREVPGFNSPMKKIALVLTLMQGDKVADWANDIGQALDELNPATDNIPALWTTFLEEFREQYLDTQAADRARTELETLTMKIPYIDEYISKFEDLCRKSNYMMGNSEVTYMFLKGLPKSLLEDVLKAPQAVDYPALKERTIQATRTQQLLQNILRQRPQANQTGQVYRPPFIPHSGFRGGAFGNFQRNNNFQRGGFQTNYRPLAYNANNNRPAQFAQGRPNNPPSYNSTNAPRSMNNVPVPMDLDRTRFNRNRGGNSNFRGSFCGQAANAGPSGQIRRTPNPSTSAPCFKCGGTDHWANKCPSKGGQFNLIDLDLEGSEAETMMSIDDIKERINAMTPDEKGALANSMEASEQDFLTV